MCNSSIISSLEVVDSNIGFFFFLILNLIYGGLFPGVIFWHFDFELILSRAYSVGIVYDLDRGLVHPETFGFGCD